MRVLKRIAWALVLLVGVVLVGFGFWALLPRSTASIDGEHAIAAVERIALGGFEQTILVRGQDRRKPVLLYLHGGPGFAHLPLAPAYSDALEAELVVVHWDQRGAGASCNGVDPATLTLERIVADTIELSEQLAARFGGGGRILLLGHSWGSIVGALAAARRPDLFHAYIGLGQVVHGARNEILSTRWVLAEAERRGDAEALAELRSISVPYANNDELAVQRRWLNAYNGSLYAPDRAGELALRPFLLGREYTVADRLSFFGCFEQSLDAMWGEVAELDFLSELRRIDVPVFFFLGRHDWNTPTPIVEEWAAVLEAPHVELVWFEEAGHVPPLESPAEFQRAVLEQVLPVVEGRGR